MALRIIHHSDPDGYSSAFIVWHAMVKGALYQTSDIHFHSINYGQSVPKEIDYENDEVYLVDFSLQPADIMEEFVRKFPPKKFTWIDHHKTSVDIEETNAELYASIPGIRTTAGPLAGCELTWMFLHPNEPVPPGIRLVGAWDTWRYVKEGTKEASAVSAYCQSIDCTPFSPSGKEFWANMISDAGNPQGWLWTKVIPEGRAVERYMRSADKKTIRGSGFFGTFAGYSAMMINTTGRSSKLFEDAAIAPETYDLMVAFNMTRDGYWTVSMYSVQPHIHCGDICKKLGEAGPIPSGGGHKGAAGFQCNWPYLETLIERS